MPLLLGLVFVGMSFVLWREFKGDHDPEEIFTLTCLLALTGLFVGYVFGLGLVVAILAMIAVLVVWCRRMVWNWGEWLDALGLQAFFWLAVTNFRQIPIAIFFVVGYVVLLILKRYYRAFSWYRSGKPGFVGLCAVSIFGFLEIVIAFLTKTNVYSAILGGWMIVIPQVILWLLKK